MVVAQQVGSRPASESDVGSTGGAGRKRRKKEVKKKLELFSTGSEPVGAETIAIVPRRRGQNLGMVVEAEIGAWWS